MRLPIRARVFRICGVAILAMLAWGMFFTAPVRAACGDYVNLRGQSTQERSTGHSRPVAFPNTDPCPCRLPAPNDAPTPCPGCSVPVTPQSAATPPVVRSYDHFAALAIPFSFASAYIELITPDPDTTTLPHSPSAVFRPPRF